MPGAALPKSVFAGNQRHNTGFPSQSARYDMSSLHQSGHDRFFSSVRTRPDEDFKRSKVKFSSRLPNWLWAVLTAILGIGSHKSVWRYLVSTTLRVLTVTSALLFACCGLVFNVYDVISEVTTTTLLIGICKTLLGAYWVGMGIYARSLAKRLFGNALFVECMRMHAKTIFKINTAVIIIVLSTTVTVANMYWTRNLLDFTPHNATKPRLREGNCGSAGANILLCEVYYGARVVYAALCLVWNLLVASILLSVCRTHTISIRRFIKELMYDNKIYEEFLLIQAMRPRPPAAHDTNERRKSTMKMTAIMELNVWDNDINDDIEKEDEDSDGIPLDNAFILNRIRNMRRVRTSMLSPTGQTELSDIASLSAHDNLAPDFNLRIQNEHVTQTDTSSRRSSSQPPPEITIYPPGDELRSRYSASAVGQAANQNDSKETDQTASHPSQYNPALASDEEFYRKALEEGKPPILSCDDILFTHFQIVRRLCSTSRLLQRWVLTIISFILMWCALFIIYWTSHTASWLGLFEFVVPLAVLYLLTSAYAEFVLPTMERLPALQYIRASPPQLKVFSFILSYNAVMTVVAGIAISFASSIVLNQVLG